MSKENKRPDAETVDNTNESEFRSRNFIQQIIDEDMKSDKYGGRVHTRFPPEPNGYLHIGHAKAICINFGIKEEYSGKCNLRFDDTNPVKEDTEYVKAIQEDIKWLGFEWDDLFYASDYFEKMYEYAQILIKKGKAYVCDLTPEETREYRGDFTTPGKNSPFRDRSPEENLDLFEQMKNGVFLDGSRVLRAKIDMASPNLNMRDPVLYRISHNTHHNTGDKWCIYPMYDYAHPIEDAIEGVTHSLCSLEFENHRPLYDWVLGEIGVWSTPPQQIEFARLNMTNTLMSKRYIRALVEDGTLDGWNDPRLHTLSGLRRRGVTPEAIKSFIDEVGVSKSNSVVDSENLDHFVREDLKMKAPRAMAVLDPLKVVITNYPEGQVEMLEAGLNPDNPEMGSRQIPFGRVVYVEREDFMEEPVKKFFRLFPGNEVRLRHAYFIKCNEVIKDEAGNVVELRCTYDPETKSGSGFTGRKVKGTLHWVAEADHIDAEVRLYDHLLTENEEGEEIVNPNSLVTLQNCKLEPYFNTSKAGDKFQFLRHGFFCEDSKFSTDDKKVFNRIVSLKSSWKKKK
ncbi:glutamine--tRNA ligase/YqeY domain fusion protein [Fusibacter sp. JL216-2]|uniref:glutamine--tRNA ligase/YqeY domain fusion protein n=1 Tax=Fusibacter sp. JL216-2 TaxID=3071453 RepID=UPI003D33EB45